jgi:hypothetical protein
MVVGCFAICKSEQDTPDVIIWRNFQRSVCFLGFMRQNKSEERLKQLSFRAKQSKEGLS